MGVCPCVVGVALLEGVALPDFLCVWHFTLVSRMEGNTSKCVSTPGQR